MVKWKVALVGLIFLLVGCNTTNQGMDNTNRFNAAEPISYRGDSIQKRFDSRNGNEVRRYGLRQEQPYDPDRQELNRGTQMNINHENPSTYNNMGDHTWESFNEELWQMTNQVRANYGLAKLKLDAKLSEVARIKSVEMASKSYLSHQSPLYGSPPEMLNEFGIQFSLVAENVAKGQRTPEEIMEVWMGNKEFRNNILDPSMTHIGVGFYDSYWTQIFIKK